MSKTLHIFKSGTHTSMEGAALSFSESDLAATAAAYDPTLHEAPITVGHPLHDLPAYGWIKSLSAQADGLYAEEVQVDTAFAEMRTAGRFKKISAAFYPPTAANNPKPGVYYLRHVAFLGAQPPAVKGLRNIAFADGDTDMVTLEFADQDDESLGLMQKFFDLMQRALRNPTSAGATVVTHAEPPITTPTNKDLSMSKELQDKLDAAEAARGALETENRQAKEQLAAFAEQTRKQAHAANTSFAEGQVKAGRVLPKDQAALIAVLNQVGEAAPVQFSEGAESKTVSALDWLKTYITGAKPLLSFGEHAPGKTHTGVAAGASDAELDAAARAYAAQHNISYGEALGKVIAV